MLPSTPIPYLSWRQIQAAALEVAELAKSADRRAVLTGRAAGLLYLGGRKVERVEFVADGPIDVANLRADVPVDVTVVGVPVDEDDFVTPLRAAALVDPAEYFDPSDLTAIPVVRAEILVVLLLAAGDPTSRADLHELLGRGRGEIDLVLARALARTHLGSYGSEQLARIAEDAAARYSFSRAKAPLASSAPRSPTA